MKHRKQQSSVFVNERQSGRNNQLVGKQSIFKNQSNSVVTSSRHLKQSNLLKVSESYKTPDRLPVLASVRPDVNGGGSFQSIQSLSPISSQYRASSRFVQSHKKHIKLLEKTPQSKLMTVGSYPTIITAPGTNITGGADRRQFNTQASRNHTQSQRSQSDERLEEWSQIFSLQQSRWQEEFSDLKARFLSDFEKQKIMKDRKALPFSKPSSKIKFKIPNEYLSLEKRTVRKGPDGLKERLRRDKLTAKRHLRQSIDSDSLNHVNHESSIMSMQPMGNHTLEVDRNGRDYQSQHNLVETSMEIPQNQLNNSTSLGRILFTKDELLAQNKVKLPSIYKKNLKNLKKNINLLQKSDSAAKLSQLNPVVNLSSGEEDQNGPSFIYGANERKQESDDCRPDMNIQEVGGDRDDPSAMRIVVNSSQPHLQESPESLGKEVNALFHSHPDENPFKILMDRNENKSSVHMHARQMYINNLKEQTMSKEEKFLDEHYSNTLGNSSLKDLAASVNLSLNINMTVNNFGPSSDYRIPTRNHLLSNDNSLSALSSIQSNVNTSQQDLLSQVQINDLAGGRPTNVAFLTNVESSAQQKRRLNQIRISRKQMLEPLNSLSKVNSLAKEVKLKSFKEVEDEHETLLDVKDKMGDQNMQIDLVRKFVDMQIESEMDRVKMKHSLRVLSEQLEKRGMTLREVVEANMNELHAKANVKEIKNSRKRTRGKATFQSKSNGFDFIRILQASTSLQPLIAFQQELKERSKRRHQKKLADQAAEKDAEGFCTDDSDTSNLEEMAHLKKRHPQFRDQDESIAFFIENVKKLIFLNRDNKNHGISKEDSDYEWVDEPEIYQSSSGESKYSNEDRELKDHLATGEPALLNTIRKYKNADKIAQMNEVQGKDDQTSHLVKYYQQMQNKGYIPKGFGYLHRKGKPNQIDAGEVQISDEHAAAIALSVNRAKYVNSLILKNVGLRDQQAIDIIRSIDTQVVRHLDISYNPLLSKRFYMELCELLADPSSHLERLEIEGNNIGDGMLHELVQAMIKAKKLVYLNVSKNRIEDGGARDLALLIQEVPTLRLLFAHFNRIMGYGGVEIAEAISGTKSLQVLDLSFNSICGTGKARKKEEMTEEEEKKAEEKKQQKSKKKKKPAKKGIQFEEGTKPAAKGFAELFARGFGESWSEAFSANKSLLHVDLSNNHLERTDVEIMAEGLKENQQILGIHFAGNDGEVDPQGFVKPGVPLSISQNSLLSRMQSDMKGGIVKNKKALELESTSNCWICEGWTEHHFTYIPGRSDNNPDHDIYKPIKLHLEIDHYEGDLMMQSDHSELLYEVYRMLPPGPHRYFYSVDGNPVVAKDHPKTQVKAEKKPKKLMLNLEKTKWPTEDEIRAMRSALSSAGAGGTPKKGGVAKDPSKKATPKGLRSKEAPPEEEPHPDYYDLDLPEVNYIQNIQQTGTIYSLSQIEKMNAVPRPGPKGLGNRNKVRTPWDFTLSVFASYKADTTRLLNDCFEMDWERTKVLRIVKNEEERERLKTYARSVYKWFREVYKFTSGSDPMNDIFCIGVNVFSDLIINGTPSLVDGKTLKLSDLDLERIQTNANETNGKFNPKNNMVRHNFLEVFFRLCDTKYLKNGAGGPQCDTITKSFKMMFDKDLFPYFKQFDSHQWRKTVLWQEDIDYTLKIALEPLKAIYKRYIGKNSLPGGQQFMSLTEFTECIISSDCLSENFGAKQIGNQFNLSMMSQVDEIEKDRHINMTFVEFLEAIVRVAEKAEIPHCKLDEFTIGVDEIDPDMRSTYAGRDLVVKIEALILFMIAKNLPPTALAKYYKTLEEFEGAGLYANDLDTGVLNLNQKKS